MVLCGENRVDISEFEIGFERSIGLIGLCCAFVCRSIPHAPLIVVELEKERQTNSLQENEEKEIVVAAKEVEEYLHRWGI